MPKASQRMVTRLTCRIVRRWRLATRFGVHAQRPPNPREGGPTITRDTVPSPFSQHSTHEVDPIV
jgi:hypothetical protein